MLVSSGSVKARSMSGQWLEGAPLIVGLGITGGWTSSGADQEHVEYFSLLPLCVMAFLAFRFLLPVPLAGPCSVRLLPTLVLPTVYHLEPSAETIAITVQLNGAVHEKDVLYEGRSFLRRFEMQCVPCIFDHLHSRNSPVGRWSCFCAIYPLHFEIALPSRGAP